MIFLFIKQTLIWKEQAQHSVFYICVYIYTYVYIYILILTLMRLLSSECKIFNYIWICICMYAKLLQLCPTLCNPLDCSQPVSYVHWISQAKILEWVAMPSSRGSSWLKPLSLKSPALAGAFFTTSAIWEAHIWIYIKLMIVGRAHRISH